MRHGGAQDARGGPPVALRRRPRPDAGKNLRGVGELSWHVSLPERDVAASEMLSRAHETFDVWPAARLQAYGAGLPKVPLLGIPDT